MEELILGKSSRKELLASIFNIFALA